MVEYNNHTNIKKKMRVFEEKGAEQNIWKNNA